MGDNNRATVLYPVLGTDVADLWFLRLSGCGLGNCFYTYFHAVTLAEKYAARRYPALVFAQDRSAAARGAVDAALLGHVQTGRHPRSREADHAALHVPQTRRFKSWRRIATCDCRRRLELHRQQPLRVSQLCMPLGLPSAREASLRSTILRQRIIDGAPVVTSRSTFVSATSPKSRTMRSSIAIIRVPTSAFP